MVTITTSSDKTVYSTNTTSDYTEYTYDSTQSDVKFSNQGSYPIDLIINTIPIRNHVIYPGMDITLNNIDVTGFLARSLTGNSLLQVSSIPSINEPENLSKKFEKYDTQLADMVHHEPYNNDSVVVDGNVLGNTSDVNYNVKTYGAKGNGTTVDTTAIQSAINAANDAGGGVVYFPVGTYLTDSLTLYSNITIRGASKRASRLRLVDNPSGSLLDCSGTTGNVKEYITIENIMLSHNISYTYVDDIKGVLVRGYYTRFCEIKNCMFYDISVYGVLLSQIDDNVTQAKSWTIDKCLFYHGKQSGYVNAIFLYNEAEYVNITNCIFNGCAGAINATRSANLKIENNTFLSCGFNASTPVINIDGTGGTTENRGKTQIIGNNINHSNYKPIVIRMKASSDYGCTVSGNHILVHDTAAVYDSITILGGRTHIITSNRLWPVNGINIGSGISIADDGAVVSDYHVIANNIVIQGGITNTSTGANTITVNNLASVPV